MEETRLPNTIILEIIQASDVSTLKNLRLTCQSVHALIDSYGVSIKSSILLRMYDQETLACFDLAAHKLNPVLSIFDIDRRIRTARWMSALILNEEYCWSVEGMAEWEQRSGLRPKITVKNSWKRTTLGLGMLWRVSEIARDVIMAEYPGLKLKRHLSAVSRTLPPSDIGGLEQRILQAQQDHIGALSITEAKALLVAMNHCFAALDDLRVTDCPVYKSSEEEYLGGPSREEVGNIDNWYAWVVLRDGPDLCAMAWGKHRAGCRKQIAKERERRTREQFLIEQASARGFRSFLTRKVSGNDRYSSELLVGEGDQDELVATWIKEYGPQ